MKNNLMNIFRNTFKGISEDEKNRVINIFYGENVSKLRLAALFILVCQLLFIVRDFAASFYFVNPLNFINLGVQIVASILSLTFFIYASGNHKPWKSNLTVRALYVSYLVLLLVSICCFTFTDMYVRQEPFGICLCFLIVFVVVPFFDILRQTLFFGTIVVFDIVVYFISIPDDPLGIIGVVIFPVLLYLASLFLRSYYIKNLVYNERTKDLNDQLVYRNKTDFLTDVSNRFCLYDDYIEAQKQKQSVGILLYDVDDFKRYNDDFSHLAGDDCLKRSSQAVKAFAAAHNGKVYRYGGEEFVVIFFDISHTEFLSLVPCINNIVYDMRLKHSPAANHPYVSVSVGATYGNTSDIPVETLLLECDNALYQAKSNGKNCFVIFQKDFQSSEK